MSSWASVAKAAGTSSIKQKQSNAQAVVAVTPPPVATPKHTTIGRAVVRRNIVADPNKPMFWGMCQASWSRPEMTDQQLIDSWLSGAGRGLTEGLFDVLCDKPEW